MHFLRPDPVRCRKDRARERKEEHIFHALELFAIDLMEIRFLSLAHGDWLFNLLIDHRAMRPILIYSYC